MSMNMIEIERALRSLRLSGIRATLETRVLQAQANQEPFTSPTVGCLGTSEPISAARTGS